jgi:hypothetical protein
MVEFPTVTHASKYLLRRLFDFITEGVSVLAITGFFALVVEVTADIVMNSESSQISICVKGLQLGSIKARQARLFLFVDLTGWKLDGQIGTQVLEGNHNKLLGPGACTEGAKENFAGT